MKKRILILSFALLLILTAGCVKDNPNEVGKIEDQGEIVELEDDDRVGKTTSIKRENLGDFINTRKMESENLSDENKLFKITVTDYKLGELKFNDEYKDISENFGIINPDEVSFLDISFEIENITNDDLELDPIQGKLITNTGEEVPFFLEFYEEKNQANLVFSEKEIKEGSLSTLLNSNPEDIENIKLVFDDSITLEFDFE